MNTPYPYGEVPPAQLKLATWTERFFAWLIDVIIVSVIVQILYSAGVASLGYDLKSFPLRSLAFFLYWTFFESIRGQSIGKMLLKLKTVEFSSKGWKEAEVTGPRIAEIKSVAIQSFGKSFLLPVDLILGWIFTNKYRQRIFNKLSKTVVIKLR